MVCTGYHKHTCEEQVQRGTKSPSSAYNTKQLLPIVIKAIDNNPKISIKGITEILRPYVRNPVSANTASKIKKAGLHSKYGRPGLAVQYIPSLLQKLKGAGHSAEVFFSNFQLNFGTNVSVVLIPIFLFMCTT